MKPWRLTAAAEDDLFDIWAYIAADNLEAADRVEGEILDACERVAGQPGLGHYRRDLTDKPVRFYAVRGTYLVVYDPATEPLEVIRILHGARDVVSELGQ
jgi:antitoxin ParD1/3/4/toxin ParE1/3/4